MVNQRFEPNLTAYLGELFSSIQGEGLRVGIPMTFVRFLGCNLSCAYCDTPASRTRGSPFLYDNRSRENPIALVDLLNLITESEVALTGGEPLLQPEFVYGLASALKNVGRTVYLETNGTLPEAMAKVVSVTNWVAMDIKVPSATGSPTGWDAAERFLAIACQNQVFVKITIDDNVLPQELNRISSIIAGVDRNIPLVIQPIFGRPVGKLRDIQNLLRQRIPDVRIIPQIHKYLGLR